MENKYLQADLDKNGNLKKGKNEVVPEEPGKMGYIKLVAIL
jgi:hypothetical protein